MAQTPNRDPNYQEQDDAEMSRLSIKAIAPDDLISRLSDRLGGKEFSVEMQHDVYNIKSSDKTTVQELIASIRNV
ncbi:hypothetical protein F5Y16DRAFT_394693 [Xylariaceae sp. FL0255]|nr:hypothetical protein F5Y16DRAFT_394693 [Xylariaceae sp. FL0255]